MMTTFLDVPFYYPATVLPKRARKAKDVFMAGAISLPIPELRADEAPVVIEAELEYDYVPEAPEGEQAAWHHKLVPVTYRRYGEHLLRPFDAVFHCGHEIPETFSVNRDAAPDLFRKLLMTMNGFYKFDLLPVTEPWRRDSYVETEFEGKIISHSREERAANLTTWINDHGLVFIDDILWRRTELPVWSIGFEYLNPELGPTAFKGERRFQRPVPYEALDRIRVHQVFWDKTMADAYFSREMGEAKACSRANRTSLELASERGHITVVGELPFGRNEILQTIFECLEYLVEHDKGMSPHLSAIHLDILNEVDANRRKSDFDAKPLIEKLAKFNEEFSTLPSVKHYNPVEYCLKRVRRLVSTEPTEQRTVEPFSHRARRARGYDTVPVQALIPIDQDGTIILIDRDDARRHLITPAAEVQTYTEIFQVDSLPAYRATGSLTLSDDKEQLRRSFFGTTHTLDQVLANVQLDTLAKCDWETWRRGAGTVLRPEGTGNIVARVWFRRAYESTLYIFPGDQQTFQAFEHVSTLGDAKRICEAALEAYGFGEEYFDRHFGDIFQLKQDQRQSSTSSDDEDGEFEFDTAFEDD
jgi:hypothetical protein